MPKIRILFVLAGAVFIAGCETAPPIVETVIVEKPVPVPCKIPPMERPAFAVDRVSPADDMVTINRALRAEIEQRRGYEKVLEAGVNACQ